MKKKRNEEICYRCGRKATSREHVPPLCLFPERKDIDIIDLRKELITVPSCDEHNSKKSMDDEFLLATLAGMVGNNSIAFVHNRTKVQRMFQRYGDHFINVISRNPKFYTIRGKSGALFPIAEGLPDVKRLNKCFEHIAYGLYYYKYKSAFLGEVKAIPAFINFTHENMKSLIEIIERRYAFHEEANEVTQHGKNPLVFQHWFIEPDEHGIIGLKMTFYEGADVYISFMPKNFDYKNNLVHLLIQNGMHVSVAFPDGKPDAEFNKPH